MILSMLFAPYDMTSFFDAISGVKKLINFILAITYPTTANRIT